MTQYKKFLTFGQSLGNLNLYLDMSYSSML